MFNAQQEWADKQIGQSRLQLFGVGKFLKNKFLHDKNYLIKSCNWSHRADNRASSLYYPGPVFDLKKVLHKLLPNKNNYSKLIKMRKKSYPPKNCPTPSRSLQKIMVRPLTSLNISVFRFQLPLLIPAV